MAKKRDWVWVQRCCHTFESSSSVYVYGYKRKPKVNSQDGGRMCYQTWSRLTGIKLEPWEPTRVRFDLEEITE